MVNHKATDNVNQLQMQNIEITLETNSFDRIKRIMTITRELHKVIVQRSEHYLTNNDESL